VKADLKKIRYFFGLTLSNEIFFAALNKHATLIFINKSFSLPIQTLFHLAKD